MRFTIALITLAALASAPAIAAPKAAKGSPLIDYATYAKLTRKVAPKREKRLLSLDAFREQAADPRVLLLDARSATAFAEGHIDGAVNLPFTDFTAESLAAVIGPDRDRPILIYCNNNFTDDRRPVALKMAPPTIARGRGSPVALNIQTFINLAGYGYDNVWELGEAVPTSDPRVGWVKGVLAG